MTRTVLLWLWLASGGVPLLWWVWSRRQVNVWQAMPVPAALLGADGTVRQRTGPASDVDFELSSGMPARGLPARGRVARTRTADGTVLVMTGVAGGALAVALPGDPVTGLRDRILADLGARMAHDINTPMSVLFGHLDLIAHEPISDTARESVRTCQRELTRLQTTASDLLALSRLRAGGGRRAPQLAGALAEEAAAGLLDKADELNASLNVEVPNERVLVDVADANLVRALRNLILNALTHGLGERREVSVAVDADPHSVTFTVTDSGIGLNDEELAHLSQPLVRGTEANASGSGLGLAIVAEVLAAHGSQLRAGAAPRGGAALSFTLPRLP